MDQYIGKMLDHRYEILERIGTGGMANVYKAKCNRLNRLVAIKILKSDLLQDEDFRRRFNVESQAVAQLSHPNIVSVYDVSRGDVEYIVMELIDGITLKQYMEKRGQLNWRESLHFITQIMRGISHAHSRGIIHRDIKPQNVMVLRDGSVRVTDFGIAYLENASQTLTQEALGSVHYISPEQAKGDRSDARSDIYSAGVVLYEMLTGRLPFEGESAVSVAIQHLSSIPLAPREINPEIPEKLELICMKAMAPDLEKRYHSADEMIADLEHFRKNPDVELDFELSDLRPEEVDEPTQLLRPEHGSTYQPPRSRRQWDHSDEGDDDYEEDDPRSKRKGIIALIWILVGIAAAVIVGLMFRTIFDSFDTPPVEQYLVPSLIGLTVEEAKEHPSVKDIFEIKEVNEVFSEEYAAGTIVEQNPEADEQRKGDQLIIEVTVSAGEDVGEMIDVRDLTVAQARVELQKLIRQYDLVIDSSAAYQKFSDEVTEGCIISSMPAAGEPLKNGDTITLIVSKGRELKEITVPSFIGQPYETVMAQMQEFKLTCTYADVEAIESDEPGGLIVWQSLEPLSTAIEWDTIKFRVSSGLPAVRKTESYDLPQDGRENVTVEVFVGDETTPQYRGTVDCADLYVTVTLKGSGVQLIRVLFDGEEDYSQTHELDFS